MNPSTDTSSPNSASAPEDDVNALEVTDANFGETAGSAAPENTNVVEPEKKPGGLKHILRRFNIYLLLFGLVILIALIVIVIAYFQAKKQTTNSVKSQTLSEGSLKQLAGADATVGNSKQVLNIQSNSVFAGKVLVRDSVEIAGNLQVGGNFSLSNINVSNIGSFGTLQASKDFSVAGNSAVQGQATFGKDLQVKGNGLFNGTVTANQLATSSLQLNGELVLTHHIIAGGPQPKSSSGPALGSGGTTSLSGSDSSGTVTVNTGSSPTAGCLLDVTFANKFASTPHVQITPVGADAVYANFYIIHAATGFSICQGTPAAQESGKSFAFDYLVAG